MSPTHKTEAPRAQAGPESQSWMQSGTSAALTHRTGRCHPLYPVLSIAWFRLFLDAAVTVCLLSMQTAKEVALKRGDEPVYFGEVGMNLMGDR